MVDGINQNSYSYTIKRGDTLWQIAKDNGTSVDAILSMNKGIKNRNRIYAGKTLILADNSFTAREDYNPQKLNTGTVKIGDTELTSLNGENLKSNFYANNWGAIDKVKTTDETPKFTVNLKVGKEVNPNNKDLNSADLLNKVVANHLQNNSVIETLNDGRKIPKNNLTNTDFYKAFVSTEVNKDNFGENGLLIPQEKGGNDIQLPFIKFDPATKQKYFTLHTNTNEILYFDIYGNKAEFKDGKLVTTPKVQETKTPELPENANPVNKPEQPEYLVRNNFDDKKLNIGKVYVNGNAVNDNIKTANYFANNPNSYMIETLNDNTPATRLDIELAPGNNIDPRDTGAKDILSKALGNNFDKAAVGTNLTDTDLYAAFISNEINGENFENNKLSNSQNRFNLVQFPALEVDKNGTKYYTLHTNDGKILYFDDKGKKVV